MSKVTAYNSLKKYCQGLGIELFGVGDISGIKEHIKVSKDVLKKLDKAVCLGVRLSASILEEITDAPTRLYFHHYRTVNAFLDQSALKVSNYIQSKGFRALQIPASIIVDWENQTAHLSHRHLGVQAGLGWIGRNNLLVSKKLGSQFRLATILTDMPLKLDKPVKNNCNTCRLCVSVCPAQAIKDNSRDFDRAKCLEKLKDFQRQKLVDQYICGVCVNVCKGK